MKQTLTIIFILLTTAALGQNPTPEDFGVRHIEFSFQSDKVDILVKSKKGEEGVAKPLLFFCQGSLPQPLLKYSSEGLYGVFPFIPDSLATEYHLIIVGKPGVPLMGNAEELGRSFTYMDNSGQFQEFYAERNLLDYYLQRNIEVIKFLQTQKWVSDNQVVVAGHSEGSTIAAKMAVTTDVVTHLIYSGGNPLGRIMSIIQESRSTEKDTDSTRHGERAFYYWQMVVDNKESISASTGDTHKSTFEYSIPPIEYLEKLSIPVLVCYGTKDWGSPFNDYMRVDFIRKEKKNFTFRPYIGTDHNYFPLTADNRPNYEVFNWDKVANDWLQWLNDQ